MNEKTRAEYEEIKAAWSRLPGRVEDVVQREDEMGPAYRYLTLTERVPRDIATVLGALMRLGTISVQTGAYLTMHVMDDVVHASVAVRCNDVDAPNAAVANVAQEMLADDHRFIAVPTDTELCRCGEPREHRTRADSGVTPDKRAGLGVSGGEV